MTKRVGSFVTPIEEIGIIVRYLIGRKKCAATIAGGNRAYFSPSMIIKTRSSYLNEVAFAPNGQLLAVCCGHESGRIGEVLAWNTETSRPQFQYRRQDIGFGSIDIDSKSRFLVASGMYDNRLRSVASQQGVVAIWNLQTGDETPKIEETNAVPCAIKFCPNSCVLVSGDMDGTLSYMDMEGTSIPSVIAVNQGIVNKIAFAPDGNYFATTHDLRGEYFVKVWDRTGRERQTLWGHHRRLSAVVFHPHGTILATGGMDGVIRFWDPYEGRAIGLLGPPGLGDEIAVRCMVYSQSGEFLIVAYNDFQSLVFWNIKSRKATCVLHMFPAISAIALSGDGQILAISNRTIFLGGRVTLWDSNMFLHTEKDFIAESD